MVSTQHQPYEDAHSGLSWEMMAIAALPNSTCTKEVEIAIGGPFKEGQQCTFHAR